jgi:hypothetical protein
MPVLNFPTNPAVNQQYSFGGKTWYWTGDAWRLLNTGAINDIPIGNVTPSTGNFTQLTSVGNISAVGNITGAFLYGNGRFLTGISGGGTGNGTNIHNGATTVDIPSPNSNVEITVAGAPNIAVFSDTNITVGVNIVPNSANLTLGTLAAPFAEGYFSGNSVWVGNAKITANTTTLTITNPQGGEFIFSGAANTGPYANANVAAYLPTYTGNISANAVIANDFYGNLHGNLSVTSISVAGNISAGGQFIGNGVGLTNTLVDRGTDTNNWDTLTQMGVYTVNRSSWSGTVGTPLDSQVFVGLLEVKTSQNQTTTQIFSPGQVDVSDIKIQWNRNLWNGSWTPWVKMTNDGQLISGGEF